MYMKKYRVVVEGNNYKTVVSDKPQKLGFHTTRFVEAKDYIAAKMKALELVVEELDHIIFSNPETAPDIDVSLLIEIESFGDCEVPGSGFTWHMQG